ncbi:uncharacterized protein LOC112053551 [Bicyclus anynana]|uniref:Uncharacterized protein LOC112053551 n=1 Tax=Bicyclus anynana TaxID=110368 RepID=A0A6J1NUD2_BICAN|nr:uncharacterized protein LOC112053551 [Bicyclus anynana]
MAKENKLISKIPLPMDPLPPIPTTALKRTNSVKVERQPLETIYHEPANQGNSQHKGAIHKKIVRILKRSNSAVNKIDAKHVTLRQKSDDLDWNYKVFNDIIDDKNKGTLDIPKDGASKALTPAIKTAEPSRVRNIKRSLKRPHSRELQGISPAVRDDKGEEKHKRRLVFDRFEQSTDFWLNAYANSLNETYAPHVFYYLMRKEEMYEVPKIASDARTCIMDWLVKVNGAEGNPATVQTAAWYFDYLFTVARAPIDMLQMLATACYWIALKVQGNVLTSRTLIRAANHAFDVKQLIHTERAVITKLKFPVHPVVAQDYISYMSWVCDASNYMELETAATLLHMAFLVADKRVSTHLPSFSAAASVTNALYLLRKTDLLPKLEKNIVYKAASRREPNFEIMCQNQRHALQRISSPCYKYKALLKYSKDRILTEKILSIVNKF